ncbi:MAG: methylenetetrahydrofolate reductase C-terminal domain-containing protein [Firmicutes bacterium]|nr:methylenetetrahydrofolate reductase C-terminal domain-containing protein [Bacillota bacterium]
MIVAEQKPIPEIIKSISGFQKILIAACGTCVTVCMAGGEKEAAQLASLLAVEARDQQNRGLEIKIVAPKRQCDAEFYEEIAGEIEAADAVLSLACGAGVQYLAERFPTKTVLPGVNTKFIGVNRDLGVWIEMCQGCGDCLLEATGGVCPVARCSKSNLNGPCGGSSQGKCEIDPGIDCGWQVIYDRLKSLGQLDRLREIREPKDWRTSRDGGPRRVEKKEMMV